MLPDLETAVDTEIVRENVHAVQAIYFAYCLERMRMFQVLERLAQLFQQGLLPLGEGSAAETLRRHALAVNRLSSQERAQLYARVLGVSGGVPDAPDGATGEALPNRSFISLWLRFVVSVAMFSRQHSAQALLLPPSPANSRVRHAAHALAADASLHGAGLTLAAARQLAAEVEELIALLGDAAIVGAFAARDLWQVIDQVNREYLGGAVNIPRYRTQAQAGSVVLQWLATHTEQLSSAKKTARGDPPTDSDLILAADQWLAASGVADEAVEEYSQPAESPSLICPPLDLPALAQDLLQAVGLPADGLAPVAGASNAGSEVALRPRGVVALFHGAAGAGKTLAAHVLADVLTRDILRVDLGQVVSKYIGETEKNLAAVFARAEQTGAVLFFDEADAVFGQRSDLKDSHDRYANLDVSALLRRIEGFEGVVVLASHSLPKLDGSPFGEDWRRCLRHVVRFPRPRR